MKGPLSAFCLRLTPACAVALFMALALLPGCSLFRAKPAAPVVTPPASAPVVAPRVEAPPKPKPAPPQKKTPPPPAAPAHPRPAPPPAPRGKRPPAPAPMIAIREINRAAIRTLLNSEVQKPDGNVIGHVVNLVTDAYGRPAEIVVNLQGFMGVGDRKAGFPWNMVRINARPGTPAVMLMFARGRPPVIDREYATAATPTRLPVIDAPVERANGTHIGRVVDVLLDGRATPQAVVLDVSDNVIQRRTIAADWKALRLAVRSNALTPVLDLSDAQINASPLYAGNLPVRVVSPTPPTTPHAGKRKRRAPR